MKRLLSYIKGRFAKQKAGPAPEKSATVVWMKDYLYEPGTKARVLRMYRAGVDVILVIKVDEEFLDTFVEPAALQNLTPDVKIIHMHKTVNTARN